MRSKKKLLLAGGMLLLSMAGGAHAAALITESEARLPPAAGTIATRGITRGPGIRVLSPEPGAVAVKSPFSLKVAFEARGGAKVDAGSIKVTYLKTPSVDLLERVKPGLSGAGIDLGSAEAPPGEHQIRVSVQDSEGRQSNAVISFTVVK